MATGEEKEHPSRGTLFVEQLNKLVKDADQDVSLDPKIFGPEFDKTLKELDKKKKPYNAKGVELVTYHRWTEEKRALEADGGLINAFSINPVRIPEVSSQARGRIFELSNMIHKMDLQDAYRMAHREIEDLAINLKP
jgi:hypothetical protein